MMEWQTVRILISSLICVYTLCKTCLSKNLGSLDLILTTLPGQFQDVHSPDKLSDHDIVSGTLKIFIPPIKKPRRKVYLYQKGDYESMRKDTLEFAKEKYFNGHLDTRSVQENFDLLTSFIQDLADKHIPSKTSRSVSSIPWGARWLSGRVSDSGARGPGFETYRRRVVSLSKTLYSPKVLVNYPGSDGSVPT